MAAKAKKENVIENGAVYVLEAGTPVYIKTADLCHMLGFSNQWAGQLTAQGVIHKTETDYGSLYEVNTTVRAYEDYQEHKRKEAMQDKDIAKAEKTSAIASAVLRKAKAEMAKAQADELAGKLHRSEDVRAMTEDLIYTFRSGMLNLPGRCALDAAKETDSGKVAAIIRWEVFALLQELSGYRYDPDTYERRARERHGMDLTDDDADDFDQ